MNYSNNISILEGNRVQLHYWFDSKTHAMDAVIQNKCEYDFLGVIQEVANQFDASIIIETEPLENGGLIRWFRVEFKDKAKKDAIKITIITALATTIFVTPLTTTITKATEALIERIFSDPELKELEKRKLELEIENLEKDIQLKSKQLDENNKVKKKKSNFYENLDKYPRVQKVTFTVANEQKEKVSEDKTIERKEFSKFILVSDELEPIEKEQAIIEIISPVLKKGPYKWTGIYEGEPISFTMKSNEFKTLVQTGQIEFKNGSSINCFLIIKRKIDNEGLEKTTSYEVLRVNNYFENDKPIETPEGKYHRQKKEAERTQLKLFTDNIKNHK